MHPILHSTIHLHLSDNQYPPLIRINISSLAYSAVHLSPHFRSAQSMSPGPTLGHARTQDSRELYAGFTHTYPGYLTALSGSVDLLGGRSADGCRGVRKSTDALDRLVAWAGLG
jgi:hypothetical protein